MATSMPILDGRRAVARLAALVIAADGRVVQPEVDALVVLDGLGLGSMVRLVDEELRRMVEGENDLDQTCQALGPPSPGAASLLLATLAELAAADGVINAREREVLLAIGVRLGASPARVAELLEDAGAGATGDPPPATHAAAASAPCQELAPTARGPTAWPALGRAASILGVAQDAPLADVNAAYLALVGRYDPAHVATMGPEFVALAVHKLADATAAWEAMVAAGGGA